MRLSRILCLYACAGSIALALLATPASPARAADRAIIVVIDGLRATEGMDDPDYRFIPRIGRDLAPLGSVARACDNWGETITVPGHIAVASGRYQYVPADGSVRSTFPYLWEYFREATGAPGSQTVVIATKAKLACLSYSYYPGYGPADSATTIAGLARDASAISQLLYEMAVHHPRVSLINLGDVDAAAHSGDWAQYTSKIRIADSLVYDLWSRVQLFPDYKDHTAFIITGDHGRHSDGYGGWDAHGDGCPGCRRIPLVCVGPEFASGGVSWTACQQIDICRTLGAVLHIPVPYAGGRVLNELLSTSAGISQSQNEPGPALPRVVDGRIVLRSPEQGGPWALRLFDVTGRLQADLVVPPGSSTNWSPPMSGILFYTLEGRDGGTHGKLVVVR
jgi:hypothetical protein